MIFKLKDALALDTIINYLHWTERIAIHRFILDNQEDIEELPARVQKAVRLIEKHKWKPPEQWINGDRRLCYWNDISWKPIQNYKHEILTEIQTIK